MKVKALENIDGIGYEDFNKGEVRNLKKDLADKLISFNYVEEVETTKKATNNKKSGD